MTRERIEDFREIVLPFLSRTLLKTNYENAGKSDAEEFEKDFNGILDLAIQALEQESCKDKQMIEVLDKIKVEIKEWYWQVDKQALAKDPCVVDAMVDLFIRTIDKYKAESEDKE